MIAKLTAEHSDCDNLAASTQDMMLFPAGETVSGGKLPCDRSMDTPWVDDDIMDDGKGQPATMAGKRPDIAYLEHRLNSHGAPRRVALDASPFHLGRSELNHCVLPLEEVSRDHATIMRSDEGVWYLRDLGSTNGCFVNGERIAEAPLANDDIIHIACVDFRFVTSSQEEVDVDDAPATSILTSALAPRSLIRDKQHLKELLLQRCVSILYQPIVCLKSGAVLGYEALARSTHEHLCKGPKQFFALAEECGLAGPLSRMLRHEAVDIARSLPRSVRLFLNVHPREMSELGLLDEMCHLRKHGLVLEIHEDAVADFATLQALRQRARSLGMKLAYDDFGAGKARLLELAEIPPDFVKLDMRLIRNIHLSVPRHAFVQGIVSASHQLGVQVIAEGIETLAEAEVCQQLGCDFGQGFFFGRPNSISAWLQPDVKTPRHFHPCIKGTRVGAKCTG